MQVRAPLINPISSAAEDENEGRKRLLLPFFFISSFGRRHDLTKSLRRSGCEMSRNKKDLKGSAAAGGDTRMPVLHSVVRSLVSMVRSSGIRRDYMLDQRGANSAVRFTMRARGFLRAPCMCAPSASRCLYLRPFEPKARSAVWMPQLHLPVQRAQRLVLAPDQLPSDTSQLRSGAADSVL